MKITGIKSIFCVALAVLLSMVFSCGSDTGDTPLPSVTNSSGFASALPSSSSVAVHEYGYCIYPEYSLCLVGTYRDCPGGGILSEYCPFASSNSSQMSSSSAETSSSSDVSINSSSSQASSSGAEEFSSSSNISISSSSSQASSSGVTQQLGYCIFYAELICLETWGDCPPPAYFSTACPYSSVPSSSSRSSSSSIASSSSRASSSSSKPSSSSSILSSSSVAKSSSSSVSLSSSSKPSSSSITATSGTFTDSRDNKVYKWVKIGTQTWMAQNLNYNVTDSKCYDNSTANCNTYGRLYNWSTVMALPSSCYQSLCASQISAKHNGICPSGWHIPSDSDWNVLIKFINPSCSDNQNCTGVGTKLKATSGWDDYKGVSGNGTDDYGFTALSGGYGIDRTYYSVSGPDFAGVGLYGNWWSATNDSNKGEAYAYYLSVYYSYDYIQSFSQLKGLMMFGVRCLKD